MANRSADDKTSHLYPHLRDDDDTQFNGEEYGNEFSKEDKEQYLGEEEYRVTNRKYNSHANYRPGPNISPSGSETDNEEETHNSSIGGARRGNNENQRFEESWFPRIIEELRYENPTIGVVGVVILVAVILVAGFILLCFVLWSPAENQTDEFDFSVFRTSVRQLQQQFKSQDQLLWRMIVSSVKSVLNSSHPSEPAVILLLSAESAMSTVHKLAIGLGNAASFSYHLKYPDNTTNEYLQFYCGKLKKMNGDKASMQLDNALNNGFHDKHVAVLFDIDLLPEDSSLILHSYCDNSNAPYKNVVIVLTATCDTDLVESGKDWGEIGDACMKTVLSRKDGFNDDNIPGLLSRIANSVVVIVREEKSQDLL